MVFEDGFNRLECTAGWVKSLASFHHSVMPESRVYIDILGHHVDHAQQQRLFIANCAAGMTQHHHFLGMALPLSSAGICRPEFAGSFNQKEGQIANAGGE